MRINFFLLMVLMISLVSAGFNICVDVDDPSPPANLSISGKIENLLIQWKPSIDTPQCSGIEKYIINRDGKKLGEVDGAIFSFFDKAKLSKGEYVYTVFAVDKVGNNQGLAIKNNITVESGRIVSGGSGGNSHVCYENWNCSEWSDCLENAQTRLCVDLNKCRTEKEKPIEMQECKEELENQTEVVTSDSTSKEKGSLSKITGAAIGALGEGGILLIGILLILILLTLIIVIYKRKKSKKILKKSKNKSG